MNDCQDKAELATAIQHSAVDTQKREEFKEKIER